MSVAAVIVAGGSGLRAGGEKPKQYQIIGGKPVIWWTLQAFLNHPGISHVQVVIGTGHEEIYRSATKGLVLPPPAVGGATRQDSCRTGLMACAGANPTKVLIHDAARPFVRPELISHVIAELERSRAVIPGLPVADTMKFAPGGIIERTVDRSGLWFVQTPQGFHYADISSAHAAAVAAGANNLTDDAAVAERALIPIRIVSGQHENRKLTTSEDVALADRELRTLQFSTRPDVRTGQGVDFHVFEKGKAVILCGVSIPHTHKLKGHSDADVAMHALTDAILGAIGEADIGVHFPPSDPQWKGAASAVFLQKAMALLKACDGVLSNVDITILAEAPKISPYIAAMKDALSRILEIAPDRIGIKATTTEKLGAIGRREGMAAFAIATVRLP
jgi:2-C-methyl-D-erythritol 4-phosphate cytidylyltransferase / 2-C-methyl-D-erythritol 2,4-cyclodiphosphate synthase